MLQAYHWSCAFAAAVYGDLPAAYGAVGIHANIIENPNREIAQKGKWMLEEFKAVLLGSPHATRSDRGPGAQ